MWEEILKALHCQKYHNIEWKTENVFPPALMVTKNSIGSVKFVEIMSRHHETRKKKTLKLIRPIQDHFLVSWVQKFSVFGFRCLKNIWIRMVIFFYFQQMFFFKTILGHPFVICICISFLPTTLQSLPRYPIPWHHILNPPSPRPKGSRRATGGCPVGCLMEVENTLNGLGGGEWTFKKFQTNKFFFI